MATSLDELKHSIRTHMVVMGGPSQQLCAFLIKLVDFLEDQDQQRRQAEMDKLSFALVEAVALHVHNFIGARVQHSTARGKDLPGHIQAKADNLFVIVGKSKSLPDKLTAKAAVLREIADTLKTMAAATGASYPDITDVNGNIL